MSAGGTWIVVADASRARIVTWTGADHTLEELDSLEHPESQKHEGDLATGGQGEVIESMGRSSRKTGPEVTALEKHAESFAKEIVAYLREAYEKKHFGELVIVAAPRELGRIRDNLDPVLEKRVKRTIDKNWAQHDTARIDDLLRSNT